MEIEEKPLKLKSIANSKPIDNNVSTGDIKLKTPFEVYELYSIMGNPNTGVSKYLEHLGVTNDNEINPCISIDINTPIDVEHLNDLLLKLGFSRHTRFITTGEKYYSRHIDAFNTAIIYPSSEFIIFKNHDIGHTPSGNIIFKGNSAIDDLINYLQSLGIDGNN